MNIIRSLKDFFINLFSGKTTDPASHPPGSKAEGKQSRHRRSGNPLHQSG